MIFNCSKKWCFYYVKSFFKIIVIRTLLLKFSKSQKKIKTQHTHFLNWLKIISNWDFLCSDVWAECLLLQLLLFLVRTHILMIPIHNGSDLLLWYILRLYFNWSRSQRKIEEINCNVINIAYSYGGTNYYWSLV